MNTRYKKMGAALCAALMLTYGNVQAEEKRIGDLIYVPAMTVQAQSGTYTLRVEGTALGTDSDDAVQVGAVAGAEFGVYVISSSGEVTPWANPLYPSEPMRIRTGEEATRFSLPKGTEFYLRQESAPQGYLFDAETLIPVTQEEIVIQNRMAGQLVVEARDSLGAPLAGVTFTIISELGETQTVVSDEQGQATVVCEKAGVYRIEETELPEGISFCPDESIFPPPVKVQGGEKRALGDMLLIQSGGRYKLYTETQDYVRVIEGKGAASRIPLLYLHTAGRPLHADHGQWFHLGLEAGKSESSLRSIPSLTNPRRFPIRNRRGITAPAPPEKTDTSGRLNNIRRPEVFWYYSISVSPAGGN